MKAVSKIAIAFALATAVEACVSTQEMPLAPNMVRLDRHAAGALFVNNATSITMHRAAELTLKNGFTYFRLEQPQLAQGSQVAGVYFSGGFATPIHGPTADVDVTVVMFHAGEPGAAGAFDAKQVLGQQ